MIEGVKNGERVLYVTLTESRQDLINVARSHGFHTDGIEIFELMPTNDELRPEGQYTVFHPAEVELKDRMQAIFKEVERVNPDRLVIDALSESRNAGPYSLLSPSNSCHEELFFKTCLHRAAA